MQPLHWAEEDDKQLKPIYVPLDGWAYIECRYTHTKFSFDTTVKNKTKRKKTFTHCIQWALITHQISLGSVLDECLHLQSGSWLQGHINSDYGLSTLHQILTLAEILPRCARGDPRQPWWALERHDFKTLLTEEETHPVKWHWSQFCYEYWLRVVFKGRKSRGALWLDDPQTKQSLSRKVWK